MVHAEHLPGSCNIEADRISCHPFNSSDWRLDHSVFQKLVSLWGPFDIDLFAARHNSQLSGLVTPGFVYVWVCLRLGLFTSGFVYVRLCLR